ncbi:hypothetical protein FOMPIDRAFT_123692 [Fomitopsis schrenkii]|uniref:Uncharacterized protein n=1 Tax=Fomitopsis schrenkii TaxID=2126942 RepID=S8DMB7_FOMSC|nr:hypothetical protein FOMPIDRAFT_123692 [Fomitopsis schrenkii]
MAIPPVDVHSLGTPASESRRGFSTFFVCRSRFVSRGRLQHVLVDLALVRDDGFSTFFTASRVFWASLGTLLPFLPFSHVSEVFARHAGSSCVRLKILRVP